VSVGITSFMSLILGRPSTINDATAMQQQVRHLPSSIQGSGFRVQAAAQQHVSHLPSSIQGPGFGV
jgi:hypothetical protein